MANRPPNKSTEFGHFKNEWLLFILCAIREVRRAFEAMTSSKWVALCISTMVFGTYAPWQLIKTQLHLLR